MVNGWWSSFDVTGAPDYILAVKLKMLKGKLKEWNLNNYGSLENRKTEILNEVQNLDRSQEQRNLTKDELVLKTSLEMEFEEMSKFEEIAWRQRSRIL